MAVTRYDKMHLHQRYIEVSQYHHSIATPTRALVTVQESKKSNAKIYTSDEIIWRSFVKRIVKRMCVTLRCLCQPWKRTANFIALWCMIDHLWFILSFKRRNVTQIRYKFLVFNLNISWLFQSRHVFSLDVKPFTIFIKHFNKLHRFWTGLIIKNKSYRSLHKSKSCVHVRYDIFLLVIIVRIWIDSYEKFLIK